MTILTRSTEIYMTTQGNLRIMIRGLFNLEELIIPQSAVLKTHNLWGPTCTQISDQKTDRD